MRQIHTAAMEIFSTKDRGTFYTEPYEAGWAIEALGFVYVRHREPTAMLELSLEVSADGERWTSRPEPTATISDRASVCLPIQQFGNWIRLVGKVTDSRIGAAQGLFLLDIYWVLKG
jgi:hypothetical protein